jgi:hypothetical protein
MGLLEASIPKAHRKKFVAAVAARRKANAGYRTPKGPTPAVINADYRAMNALPLWLQAIADKRARHLG